MKVIQKWALRSTAPKQQQVRIERGGFDFYDFVKYVNNQVTWEYGSPGGLHPFSLYYTIKNQGPSVADGPKVLFTLHLDLQ